MQIGHFTNQTVRTDMCFVRDSDKLKGALRYQLKKMGFITEDKDDKKGHPSYSRLARRTGIETKYLSAYFNHNRYIWNEANGRAMEYISQTNLLILCLFAGVAIDLNIELEPLEDLIQ